MKKISLLIITLLFFHANTFGQQEVTTKSGKKVLLKEDGTWVYIDSVFESNNGTSTSVQCNGMTKAGNRCKRKTLSESGFCNLHSSQKSGQVESEIQTVTPKAQQTKMSSTVQCSGTTKAGKRCSRMTSSPNGRCYQH